MISQMGIVGCEKILDWTMQKESLISFIDSDDFVDPEMFYDMMNGIMNSSADAAVCDIKLVYDDKNRKKYWP